MLVIDARLRLRSIQNCCQFYPNLTTLSTDVRKIFSGPAAWARIMLSD